MNRPISLGEAKVLCLSSLCLLIAALIFILQKSQKPNANSWDEKLPAIEKIEYCISGGPGSIIYLVSGGQVSSQKSISELIGSFVGLCPARGDIAINIRYLSEFRCNCSQSNYGCVKMNSGKVFPVSQGKKSQLRECVGECSIGF